MKSIKRGFALLMMVGLPFIFSACLDSDTPATADPNVQLIKDIAAIDSYLTAQGLTAVKDANGVRMVIQKLGTKLPATSSATTVKVEYIGKLFQLEWYSIKTQPSTPYVTVLNKVIGGWQIAFTTLPAGSVATLYIPSYWGYGSSANGSIPANSILVFDVTFNEAVITDAEKTKLKSDTVAIDNYLAAKLPNPIIAEKDTTGIRYVITAAGTGAKATWYDKVTAKFTYKSISDDTKTLIAVDQVPSEFFYSRPVDYANGLKVGLQKLAMGGKATFYIPSGLGFGTTGAFSNGVNVIPANTNLIIEVEITNITQ